MREGGKNKHLRKKIIEPISGKVNEGDEIKKKPWPILKKVNHVNEGDKKNKHKKNIAGKIFFYSKWTFFSEFFFYLAN